MQFCNDEGGNCKNVHVSKDIDGRERPSQIGSFSVAIPIADEVRAMRAKGPAQDKHNEIQNGESADTGVDKVLCLASRARKDTAVE